ncbi:MAG TPA: hypothetical protein VNZ53_25835 [Steroidobacteraceae bacterium]|jgi:hypothetical protein|nr:hypothetical protein [Steroidobacteraceae bacterium]
MKVRNIFSAGIMLVAAIAGIGSAGAAQVLYDGSGFVQGQQSFVQSFNISGPGTLTVTLSNVAWPEQLASLNMVLGTTSGLLGPEMGAGTETFKVTGGRVFAQWFGVAQGPLDLGVYSMNIVFQSSGVTPVPLPASIALLASGLLLLGWQRRHRNEFRLPSNLPA